MATLVLSAVGMAVGGSVGGSLLGLSMATVGRAAGAVLGRVIDQRILGSGSDAVEVGRVDRFRLTGSGEGGAVARVHGRMRVGGHVIWATHFVETESTTGGGGGKWSAPQPPTTRFDYSVSLALALCEGEIVRVGRVWADGVEVSPSGLNMRVYKGTATQQPDPKIVAVEGADHAPAYRGTAYVVMEDLPLGQFGNRVPQFTFEVMRPSEPGTPPEIADIARQVRGVALIPGTGEYSLATTQVNLSSAYAESVAINVNSPSGATDFSTSITALEEELPRCGSVSLVVSWFGSDLRCGACEIRPKVEQREVDGDTMPWQVAGITREDALLVPRQDDRPVYGGTPADAAVVEGIRALKAQGFSPMFYPFILMEQMGGNTLPDPYTGQTGQPRLPWRGRITLSVAPGVAGTPDRSAAAAAEVAAFMGAAQVSDFALDGTRVTYSGSDDWGYRRFILHNAFLCKAAGGVDAFCVGSEMVGLTQIRGAGDSFPAVAALRQLAGEVRGILGADCKITYAADWSEYHGYQPAGTGDKYFHLDPLWADENIDFIGVDNYMPLSDWRDGQGHADAGFGSIYNLDYLAGNVAGGEGYDWFYHSPEARDAQIRTPITDGDGEPWVWRYKDFKGWWQNEHHDRIDGQRVAARSPWVPGSKPFWFTEFGCAALDKGTNQPNKFLDPKSSESLLPYYSNGLRDDFMQMQYLRAIFRHFADAGNNPVVDGPDYAGPMVDMTRAHVWCWDARPYPFFPGNTELWSDGDNYRRGHWLNGRAVSRTLAQVVTEICATAGVTDIDVARLYGVVRGYVVPDVATARAQLQPLLLAYGIEVAERDGRLVFRNRDGIATAQIGTESLAHDPERRADVTLSRSPAAEIDGRVQVGFVDVEADYEVSVAEDVAAQDETVGVTRSEFALGLTRGEGAGIAARWINEAQVARDTVTLALPPSQSHLGAGDVITLSDAGPTGRYRIDRIEEAGLRLIEATRVDPEIYLPQRRLEEGARLTPFVAPGPVTALFMDLPLIRGDERTLAPYLAATADPWSGGVALYGAAQDSDYILQEVLRYRSVVGVLTEPLPRGRTGLWDRHVMKLRLVSGALKAVDPLAVLSGANVLALGDGSVDDWEILQFAQAQLVDTRTYALTELLRGQRGTQTMIRDVWPAGTKVVLMDDRPVQVTIPTGFRGLDRHFRYGPVKRSYDHSSYRHVVHAFKGNGDRPYPVVHLKAVAQAGDLAVSWIRQTRIGGNQWTRGDVPLGEERESYLVQIRQGDLVRREVIVTSPDYVYPAAQRQADVGNQDYAVAVAQLSPVYGPGPFVSLVFAS